MQFYTTNQLSKNQQLTPEGYLLCIGCPVCRTGTQTYAHGEIPVESNDSGLIFIDRPEGEVFRPETIASFNGKPIVDEHPDDGKVTPLTWNEKAVGVVLNPRRGDGLQFDNDFMYADLLITNQDAIQAVRDGKRELSAGYDAEYEQLNPGRGRQHNIVGNHVALVAKGRCGPHCAIGDSGMAIRQVTANGFRARLRKAVRTHDEAGVLNAVAELQKDPELMGEVLSGDDLSAVPGAGGERDLEGHHVTINVHGAGKHDTDADPSASTTAGGSPAGGSSAGAAAGEAMPEWAGQIIKRVEAVEQMMAALAQELGGEETGAEGGEEGAEAGSEYQAGEPHEEEQRLDPAADSSRGYGPRIGRAGHRTGDRAITADSTAMQQAFVTMLSQAEILAPGIRLVTFDSAATPRSTMDAMCSFKRRTLDAAYKTDSGKGVIETVLGGARKPVSFFDAKFTCDSVGLLFSGAASLMAQHNSAGRYLPSGGVQPSNGFSTKTPTMAEINKRNAEFYSTISGR